LKHKRKSRRERREKAGREQGVTLHLGVNRKISGIEGS
jgi:hypothetical protein